MSVHHVILHFRGEHAFLSNFYKARVPYQGRHYPTVEHAFQAAKTLDEDERFRIERAFSPGEAKRLGRAATLRADWEQVKLTVMKGLLQHKFLHQELMHKLVATGEAELIEGTTWHDMYWGICLCPQHEGRGDNHLGQLLMKLRTALRGPG